MKNLEQISVVIPALNEAGTVGGVVEEAIKATGVKEVIVVDNGSEDDTAECAARAGAVVIQCNQRGFGRALIAGFKAARSKWILKIDADIKNPSSQWIKTLIEAVEPGCSLVKATWRNDDDPLPITSMLLRPGFSKLFPDLCHIDLPSGGIYIVNKEQLPLDQMSTGYAFDIDVLIRIYKTGDKVKQIFLGEVYDRLRPISAYREMARELFSFMVDAASPLPSTSLLAVMAHADDAEIWAGGTLLKHAQIGSKVALVIVTSDVERERRRPQISSSICLKLRYIS